MQRVENATLEAKVATCSAPLSPPYMLHSPPKTLLKLFSPLWHHPVDVGKAFFIIVFENCRQDTDEGGHYRCAKLTNAACVSSVCMLRVCVCVCCGNVKLLATPTNMRPVLHKLPAISSLTVGIFSTHRHWGEGGVPGQFWAMKNVYVA